MPVVVFAAGCGQIEHSGSAQGEDEVAALKVVAAERIAARQTELDLGLADSAGSGPLQIVGSKAKHPWEALCRPTTRSGSIIRWRRRGIPGAGAGAGHRAHLQAGCTAGVGRGRGCSAVLPDPPSPTSSIRARVLQGLLGRMRRSWPARRGNDCGAHRYPASRIDAVIYRLPSHRLMSRPQRDETPA